MRTKTALLLTGAMTLSILMSACSSQAEAPSPDAAYTPSPSLSATAEPAASPVPSPIPSTEVSVPSAEPSEEPSQAEESSDLPTVTSSAPAVSSAAPSVSTPSPAVSTPAPAISAAVVDVPPVSAEPQPAAEPSPEPAPEPTPAATRETAMTFIGKSAASLIAAIGQPYATDYAPSCLGDGEDGELFYNGFTVYTYREGYTETVQDVI